MSISTGGISQGYDRPVTWHKVTGELRCPSAIDTGRAAWDGISCKSVNIENAFIAFHSGRHIIVWCDFAHFCFMISQDLSPFIFVLSPDVWIINPHSAVFFISSNITLRLESITVRIICRYQEVLMLIWRTASSSEHLQASKSSISKTVFYFLLLNMSMCLRPSQTDETNTTEAITVITSTNCSSQKT